MEQRKERKNSLRLKFRTTTWDLWFKLKFRVSEVGATIEGGCQRKMIGSVIRYRRGNLDGGDTRRVCLVDWADPSPLVLQ